ncbi:hypothetical protein [uncultured Jatrophihabitans sp.]|uniref:hypothetical protein n=1 Tax=uncultured Jatrophihabitans sp. TaxID=1610747 RepID=UPI0035C94C96
MTSQAASIVPITLTVDDRTGLTLYAPPWEDEDGEEWQGFLGDGRKILLYPSTEELAAFIATGEENDLSDHPGYGQVLKATPDELKPSPENHYDLDQVYEWAGGEPDPVHVSALADVVDMVTRIADCCDDGALRRLLEGTPAYAELVDEDNSYQGKDGRKRWNELGDTIAESWERAIKRASDWLEWVGDFSETEFDADDSVWERVGAEPIAIRIGDETYLTVRAEIPIDPDTDEVEMAFLGSDGTVSVFHEVTDLARFCREATGHRLHKLEWWDELAELDDEDFTPDEDATFDLRKPSGPGTELVVELAEFCGLEADLDVLDGPNVDRDDWRALVDEVRTCLQPAD